MQKLNNIDNFWKKSKNYNTASRQSQLKEMGLIKDSHSWESWSLLPDTNFITFKETETKAKPMTDAQHKYTQMTTNTKLAINMTKDK